VGAFRLALEPEGAAGTRLARLDCDDQPSKLGLIRLGEIARRWRGRMIRVRMTDLTEMDGLLDETAYATLTQAA